MKPRKIAVHSSQIYYKAWFHCFGQMDGKPIAIIENLNGGQSILDLTYHHVEFLEPLEWDQKVPLTKSE